MADRQHIPSEPTPGVEYFRPSPLPPAPFPDGSDEGYLVMAVDAPWLSLDELDALPESERDALALSPLDLVVGGIATAGSLLGQGLLAEARVRLAANSTRDDYGMLTIDLMYLESGSGSQRRTYRPQDLILVSATERRPGSWWRPWCSERMPGVPEHWRTT